MHPSTRDLPLTPEHQHAYRLFLTWLNDRMSGQDLPGPPARHLAVCQDQLRSLEASIGGDTPFDTALATKVLLAGLFQDLQVFQADGNAVCENLHADFARVLEGWELEHELEVLSEAEVSTLAATLDAISELREVRDFPRRTEQARVAFASTWHAFASGAGPSALMFALQSGWLAYENYYRDFHLLKHRLFAEFKRVSRSSLDLVSTFERRVADRADAAVLNDTERRLPAELQRPEFGSDTQSSNTPASSNQRYFEAAGALEAAADWYPANQNFPFGEFNPANGLPMLSGSGIDVQGNPFGLDN
jgi:hypothetical protein